MQLTTIDLKGISLDVYYKVEITHDGHGTGDSPTLYEFDIIEISLRDSCIDIQELLAHYTDEIEHQLLQQEKEK